MDELHTDIVEYILDRLPIESALHAKRVCKTWKILLRSKTDKVGFLFVESYYYDKEKNKFYYGERYDSVDGKRNYNYSSIKLDNMLNGEPIPWGRYMDKMLGSFNGLVCFGRQYGNPGQPFLVCNPITGEVLYVPTPDKSIAPDCYPTDISGFGYCHSTNEYKIVRMYSEYNYKGPRKFHVLVYTIGGGGGWRNKESTTFFPNDTSGVYANGALYWLFFRQHIMAFDLEHEKMKYIDLSHFKESRSDCYPKLLGGNNNNIYLVFSKFYRKPYSTQIWEYKREITNTTNACDLKENYHENSWQWVNEFSIEWGESFGQDMHLLEPLAITKNNEFLLRFRRRTIYCYDLKTSTLHKVVDRPAMCYREINIIPHVNSIVSMPLKDEEVQDDK